MPKALVKITMRFAGPDGAGGPAAKAVECGDMASSMGKASETPAPWRNVLLLSGKSCLVQDRSTVILRVRKCVVPNLY
jgi:hypothetical protein